MNNNERADNLENATDSWDFESTCALFLLLLCGLHNKGFIADSLVVQKFQYCDLMFHKLNDLHVVSRSSLQNMSLKVTALPGQRRM